MNGRYSVIRPPAGGETEIIILDHPVDIVRGRIVTPPPGRQERLTVAPQRKTSKETPSAKRGER